MDIKNTKVELGFGCVLAERNFEQVGDGVGAEFFHDVGAVRLNGFDANT
jgi:hypothetical protein